ncbi:CBS domain-containing protein [Cohaesibacter sp. ES.047]|uniref:CBS domain-containing protein n=1 Tax=Cohaesibacter sp. ES.047 TaxID=1798205 RepID=UPI000BB837E8|nr:CBS domain-containing protein [Cohaesibacter sp. ES.047]SNY94245.1 CBS domain-containing protein [Cohaesibacter sp. ES.047]
MTPKTYQGPRASDETQQNSTSQDARLAFEKTYSETKVRDILKGKSADLFTVTRTMTIAAATAELAARRVGNLPVVDHNLGLVGVISERDIVAAVCEVGEEAMGRSVEQHMTMDPATCKGEDLIVDVMQIMTDGHFRHMPVMDGPVLVGVISIRDIVMHRVQEVEYETLRLKQLMVG